MLLSQRRLRPVTYAFLREMGATHFAWVCPGEFGKKLGRQPAKFGAFVYTVRGRAMIERAAHASPALQADATPPPRRLPYLRRRRAVLRRRAAVQVVPCTSPYRSPLSLPARLARALRPLRSQETGARACRQLVVLVISAVLPLRQFAASTHICHLPRQRMGVLVCTSMCMRAFVCSPSPMLTIPHAHHPPCSPSPVLTLPM